MDQEAWRYIYDAIPFASSRGWVLLLRPTSWEDDNCRYFSLYGPHSNRFVKLPKLEDCHHFAAGRVTISVDETSLVSVFYACLDGARCSIILNVCHVGANNWKNFKFQLPGDVTDVEAVLYADGFVYCVLNNGCQIVIFDVALQDWKFFSHNLSVRACCLYKYYVVFNGDLLKWVGSSGLCCFWRFDKSLNQWVQQESLAELALFLAHASVFPVRAVGELSSYANTVHDLALGTQYMSLITGKLEESRLYHALDCDWFCWVNYCWIDPPRKPRLKVE